MNTDCLATFSNSHLNSMLKHSQYNTILNYIVKWEYQKQMTLLDSSTPLVEFYDKYDTALFSNIKLKQNSIKLTNELTENEINTRTIDALKSVWDKNSVIPKELTNQIVSLNLNESRSNLYKNHEKIESDIRKVKYRLKKNDTFISNFKKSHGLDMVKSSITAFPCPENNCNGCIMKLSKKCNVCDVKACLKCEVVFSSSKHKCEQTTLDTLKEINQTTKRCPNCSVRIHRIHGCNHMWCSKCYTGFDYTSGKIISDDRNSNPHLANFRALNRTHTIRNTQDLICGGIINLERVGDRILQPWQEMNGIHIRENANILSKCESYVVNQVIYPAIFRKMNFDMSPEKYAKLYKEGYINVNPFMLIHRMCFLITYLQKHAIPILRKDAMKNDLYQDDRVNFIRKKINENDFIKIIKNTKKENEIKLFKWQLIEMFIEIAIPETNNIINIIKTTNAMKVTDGETETNRITYVLTNLIPKYLEYYETMLRLFDFYNLQIINNCPEIPLFDLSQIFTGRINTNDNYYSQFSNYQKCQKCTKGKFQTYNLGTETCFVPHSAFLRDHYSSKFNDVCNNSSFPYPFLRQTNTQAKNVHYWNSSVHYTDYTFGPDEPENYTIPFMYEIKQDFKNAFSLKNLITKRLEFTNYTEGSIFDVYKNISTTDIPSNLKLCRKSYSDISKIYKLKKLDTSSISNLKALFSSDKISEIREKIGFPLPGGIKDIPTIQNNITQLCSQS